MTKPPTDPTGEPHLTKREMEDELLIQALVEGATQVQAGRIAGVSERTVRRRLDDPAFVRAYQARRRVVLDVSRGRLFALHGEAVDTIGDLMATADSERVRLAAALEILKQVPRAEAEELADRVAALEADLHAGGLAPGWDPPPLDVIPERSSDA